MRQLSWIYQYFNDELSGRRCARNRRAAKTVVSWLSVTPRYVVEFLTDNTLGRICCEMMQGAASSTEVSIPVRQPSEIFLKPGETAPEQPKQD